MSSSPPIFGLSNSNSSCYINAVIQLLNYLPFEIKEEEAPSLAYHLNYFLKHVRAAAPSAPTPTFPVYNIVSLKAAIYSTLNFESGQQQDAHELLIKMLDVVAARQGEQITLKSAKHLRCKECQHTTIITDSDTSVHLSVTDGARVFDVNDALDHYYQQNTLVSGYQCDKCSRSDTTFESTGVTQQPHTLIVVIKKYTHRPRHITFAETSGAYNLAAVIHHVGGMEGGHYFIEVKDSRDTGVWHRIDDQAITTPLTQYTTDSAYILVYMKK